MPDTSHYNIFEGRKRYELSNHLGNVLAVITDRKHGQAASGTEIQWFDADVVSAQQYYPFGMLMPDTTDVVLRRQYTVAGNDYRYGFNGKEGDDEVKGDDNQQDYGMRIYDPRVGRFLSVDPITREYPELTPYQFASNTPIQAIDLDGLEMYYSVDGPYIGKADDTPEIRIVTNKDAMETIKANLACKPCKHGWIKEDYHSQPGYTSANQAAMVWAFEYQGKSHAFTYKGKDGPVSKEYGAMIGSKKTVDDIGKPITLNVLGTLRIGDDREVDVLNSQVPDGWDQKEAIHTHTAGKDSKNPEDFSPYKDDLGYHGDMHLAIENKLNLYLATPKGDLKVYDYKSKIVKTIYEGLPNKYGNGNMPSYVFKSKLNTKTQTWDYWTEYPKYSVPNIDQKSKKQGN